MDAVQKEVPDMIITVLSLWGPKVGDGLTLFTAGEFGERAHDVGIARYETRRFLEDAKSHAELR